MNLTGIIGAIAGVIIAIFAFLFKREQGKRIEAEERAEQAEEETAIVSYEKEAEVIAGDKEVSTSEEIKAVDLKVEQALKEIHEAVKKSHAEIYNEKVKGWNRVKR